MNIGDKVYLRKNGNLIGVIASVDDDTIQVRYADSNIHPQPRSILTTDANLAAEIRGNPEVFSGSSNSSSIYATDGRPKDSGTGLSTVNNLVGALCLIGGIYGLFSLWPDAPPSGYVNKSVAYLPAVYGGVSGFISALIFFNFAALLQKK